MDTKVSNLTVNQLKKMINDIVKEKIDNLVEDYEALTSEKFLKSIAKARHEYKAGKYKTLEEVKLEVQGSHNGNRNKRYKQA